jgi:transposase
VLQEGAQAQKRLGLAETAPGGCGSEAGRDGFWLHRFLQAPGIAHSGVAASSLAGKRRQRRAKSAGVAVRKVGSLRRREAHGARHGWRVVPVPPVAAEAQRPLHRDLETLKQERARTTTRLTRVLSSQGGRLTSLSKVPEPLEALRLWEGSPLPRGLCRRGLRGDAHHPCLRQQSAEWEAERRALRQTSQEAALAKVRQLLPLRGIGIHGAW